MIDSCLKEEKGVWRGWSVEVYRTRLGGVWIERLSCFAHRFVDRLPFLTLTSIKTSKLQLQSGNLIIQTILIKVYQ